MRPQESQVRPSDRMACAIIIFAPLEKFRILNTSDRFVINCRFTGQRRTTPNTDCLETRSHLNEPPREQYAVLIMDNKCIIIGEFGRLVPTELHYGCHLNVCAYIFGVRPILFLPLLLLVFVAVVVIIFVVCMCLRDYALICHIGSSLAHMRTFHNESYHYYRHFCPEYERAAVF